MNTRINYMYRDASNYKSFNTAVVDGILSDTDCHTIYYCCDDDGGQRYFIPHMVGLPEKTFEDYGQYDDDHPWFEIDQFFAEGTNDAPTVDLTAKQLVENFQKMAGQWDNAIAREQAEAKKGLNAATAGEQIATQPKTAATPYSIRMTANCSTPTVTMTIDVPNDCDAEEYINKCLDTILSESFRQSAAQPKTATTLYSIRMTASCFAPTVTMTIDVPKDRDAEEYIDEYLGTILSEEFRFNCEWEFV